MHQSNGARLGEGVAALSKNPESRGGVGERQGIITPINGAVVLVYQGTGKIITCGGYTSVRKDTAR